jgi:hypothetical protein
MMGPVTKLLIGLAAVLLLGWINYGPLGHGKDFIALREAEARAVIAETNLTNIKVELARNPLRRAATLSGPADDFQRNGMGSFKGLTQRVADVRGIARVRWADEPGSGGFILPLLAEILLLMGGGYLLGIGLAMLILRRKPRDRYAP